MKYIINVEIEYKSCGGTGVYHKLKKKTTSFRMWQFTLSDSFAELNLYYFAWFDLELTDEFNGLYWYGYEFTYSLENQINFIIEQMRKIYPTFGVMGEMTYSSEESDDTYSLVVGSDGFIEIKNIEP